MARNTEKKVSATDASARNRRRMVVGVVKSDRMEKTITVRVERLVRHRKFGKYLRRYTTCKAHDEKNEARVDDVVEIMETRPLSATKRWRLARIVRRAATVPAETSAE
ncbi:MAG: 30S ribosomal protein S17 [Planctomycetota bacterium]|jgi:small subunit ribosomal protein S17